jgi:acyl-CoA thioesterase
MATEAFFRHADGVFSPSEEARGPWDPNSLHGRVLVGLLARTFEQDHGDEAFQCSRLTTELFRLPPFAPLEVTSEVIRDGRRIRVIDGSVTAEGVELARARAVMLRRAEQPAGRVWGPPAWDAPDPDAVPAPEPREGMSPMWETRAIQGTRFGDVVQKRAWLRETRALVEGEPMTPFLRAAVAADFTNPFANSGDRGLEFVNADVTLYLHRYPTDEWLGFEVAGHHSTDGVAVAECQLYDRHGQIGRSLVCGVANQRRREDER